MKRWKIALVFMVDAETMGDAWAVGEAIVTGLTDPPGDPEFVECLAAYGPGSEEAVH